MLHFRFILRQIRGSGKQAVIFILCVALSLLILTSLGGFSRSVRSSMLKDARQLHAADIIIHSHQPYSRPLVQALEELENEGLAEGVEIHEFYSMAANPGREKSLLSHLKVVGKGYPFYGRVELASGREFSKVLAPGSIIVEQSLLERLQAEIGDSLQIGSAFLTIADVVTREPDRPVSFFSFGPRIFIAAANLAELDLIRKGSRIEYRYLLKVHDPGQIDRIAGQLSAAALERQENVRTFRTADSRVRKFFENFLFFLNLIGIFTLLLAGIGIQTSLHAVLRESRYTIAIMKSVGATSRFIRTHFIGMIMLLGTAGTLLGLALSSLLQFYFPVLFAGILPTSISLVIAWDAVFKGLLLGTAVVCLFSYLPLRQVNYLKPAFIFRKETDQTSRGFFHYGAVALIVLFFLGLVIWQLEDVRVGLYFMLGLSGLIGFNAAATQGLMLLLRRKSPRPLALRQALRGLFRPNNATRAIIITLSASLAVIFSIYHINQNLRATFIQSYPPDLPNAYFLDIQPDQKNEFAEILGREAEYYPIIRARLAAINGSPIKRERERERRSDNLAREFNLTYRDYLLQDEQMLEGETLFPAANENMVQAGEVPVSVLDTVAEIGDMRVGDLLEFNVQGIPLKARITSMRTRTESRVRPFFYFVFLEETLRDAPQTIFSAVRIDSAELNRVQNTLTARLPNITVIDVGNTIEVLARIMDKMASIVQFFTSFSIIAGLLIIISSVFATRLVRTREAVYFKVLGAKASFVLRVFAYENLIIASGCAVLAGLISHAGSWIVCRRVLDIPYHPLPGSTIVMIGTTLLLVLAVGLGASASVLRQKPVAFLRDEEQE
ncbi:MAG: FtsX-like permease family protein [Desulfobulbaceae bacterium]|nr:FtsX-like permease family protein [Desulfobulbaceae bacterium]